MTLIGKDTVKAAMALAKAHGLEMLGWNEKPGKEFISVNSDGDGSKLEQFRSEIEKSGWRAWPVSEDEEGYTMDFGLAPPPAGYKPKVSSTKQHDISTPYGGTEFCYSGLTTMRFFWELLWRQSCAPNVSCHLATRILI
jgi:hypothetical protein